MGRVLARRQNYLTARWSSWSIAANGGAITPTLIAWASPTSQPVPDAEKEFPMADLSIDAARYIRAPRLSAANALSLGQQLLQNVPETPPEPIATAASRIELRVSPLSEAFGTEAPAVGARPHLVDIRIDRAWGSLEKRLAAADGLSEEVDKVDRERAAELHNKFFGEGLAFLKLEYLTEHAESEKRLKWIAGDVETDLARLVGANYIENVRAAHRAYGEALGITASIDPVLEAKLREPLRALADAIGNYAMQVIAWYSNLDASSPGYAANVEAVKKALAPIDKFREGQGTTTTNKAVVAR